MDQTNNPSVLVIAIDKDSTRREFCLFSNCIITSDSALAQALEHIADLQSQSPNSNFMISALSHSLISKVSLGLAALLPGNGQQWLEPCEIVAFPQDQFPVLEQEFNTRVSSLADNLLIIQLNAEDHAKVEVQSGILS